MVVMSQDIGDVSSVLSWTAGFSVADVCHSGCGACVLDEDFAVQISHGDVVAGSDDEDLLAGEPSVNLVVDPGEHECAGSGQGHDSGPCREVLGLRCGPVAPRRRFGKEGLGARSFSFGEGFPRRQRRDAPGQPLVGALGVVNVVERVDLGLQLGQRGCQRLFVEVAEVASSRVVYEPELIAATGVS